MSFRSNQGQCSLCGRVRRILPCFQPLAHAHARSHRKDQESVKDVLKDAATKSHAESAAAGVAGDQHKSNEELLTKDTFLDVAPEIDGGGACCGSAKDECGVGFRRAFTVNMADLQPSCEAGRAVDYWVAFAAQMRCCADEGCKCGVLKGELFQYVPDATVIGVGAFGTVWRATHKQTGGMFAVKNVAVNQTDELAMRERVMAREIHKCSHPCIVGIHSVWEFSDIDLYSIVMEYCPGGSLLDRVACQRTLATLTDPYVPPSQTHAWIGQVFCGLEHLHLNSGVLFRDLKPDNVVLDSSQCAKLTDFGLGRIGTDLKGGYSLGLPPGTPGYIAPELLRGEPHDFKADLFSFGVLIWLLLSGGVADKEKPQPPHNFDEAGDFRVLFDDWCTMQEAARNASALKCCGSDCNFDSTALVLELVQRSPDARPEHDSIRAHPFMQRLELSRRQRCRSGTGSEST